MYPSLVLTLLPPPLDLDGITVERARALHGRLVSASFVVQKPTYTLTARGRTVTVIGAADRADERHVERGAVLRGDRLFDVPDRKRFNVIGRLRVIDCEQYTDEGKWVFGAVEIRVEE